MSVLTDTDLRLIIKEASDGNEKTLVISPYDEEKSLTPVGYDLRVGVTYATSDHPVQKSLDKGKSLEIKPHCTALIQTLETIEMPSGRSLTGLIESKVSKVSRGLSHISTTVDPDWKGPLLIAVHNHSSRPQKLSFGEAFCTIVFFTNLTPSTKPCKKEAGRHDILLEAFESDAKARQARRRVMRCIPPFIILAFATAGWLVFKSPYGLSAGGLVGVGVAQYVAELLR